MSQAATGLNQKRADLAAVTVGAVSVVVQTALLRRLLGVFSGNEIVIALSLSIWLAGAGAGGLAGSGWVSSGTAEKRLRLAALALGLFLLTVLWSTPILRPALRLMPGEGADPLKIFAAAAMLLLVPSFLVGLAFPLFTVLQPGSNFAAPRAYAREALGALIAGCALTMVYYWTTPPSLALAVSFAVLVLIAHPLYWKVPHWFGDPTGFNPSPPSFRARVTSFRARMLPAVFILFVIMLMGFFIWGSFDSLVFLGVPDSIILRDTRAGLLGLTSRAGEKTFFLDGSPEATIPDPDRDQTLAHVPLALLPAPRRALVIGGAYSSLAPEMLRHPLTRLDFIQPDPGWLDLERQCCLDPATLPRLSVFSAEPHAWLRAHPRQYDVIILNLPAPTSAAGERFFTAEFFALLRDSLAPGGILTFTAGATPPNLAFSRGDAALFSGLVKTARSVFPRVVLLPLDLNLVLAGDNSAPLAADPALLSVALARRGIDSIYLTPAALASDLDPARVNDVERRIDRAPAGISTTLHPRAYLSGLTGWAERVNGSDSALVRWLEAAAGFPLYFVFPFLLLPLPALGLRFGSGRARAGAMAAAAGFGSIVIEVALLIAYQMQAGSIYFALAGLTAAFMAGLGLGSGRAARARAGAAARAAAVIVTLAAGLAVAMVAFAARFDFSSPLTFALFAVLLALLGAGVGAMFVAANALAGGSEGVAGSAGLVYGLELFGSAAGGLIAGVILIPCFGVLGTLLVGAAAMLASGGLAWPGTQVGAQHAAPLVFGL